MRSLQRWARASASPSSFTVMVPALYNRMPAENLALGWLNEIDALVAIRQRMMTVAKITGWDMFTFHTQHNLDHYFDSTIAAVRETWVKEGNLSNEAILETRRTFSMPYDYHRVQPRLVENLVFQSSLMDWLSQRGPDTPLQFHVIGTALVSALVSTGAVSFENAVMSAMRFGRRWDESIGGLAQGTTENEVGWARFNAIRNLMEGRSALSLGVGPEDLPVVAAPASPFRYSRTAREPSVLISTAAEAAVALESLNLASWSYAAPHAGDQLIRGWLISPLHPMARLCRWTVSNYLLATPATALLFLDQVATIRRMTPVVELPVQKFQNRFRLSRMKVTGP